MGFGFRDLEVWKKAVKFAEAVISVSENLYTEKKHFRLVENLEAAVVSVAANIAEGKGRYSKKEFVQFLYVARGSLYETVACLEIFKNRKWIGETEYNSLLKDAEEIAKMINGLISSIR
jgi:four helix bundle protein